MNYGRKLNHERHILIILHNDNMVMREEIINIY
jgi:hypothetical protein